MKNNSSDYVCLECGAIYPLPRLKQMPDQFGKKVPLLCPTCQKETLHINVKNADVFWSSEQFVQEEERVGLAKEAYEALQKSRSQGSNDHVTVRR